MKRILVGFAVCLCFIAISCAVPFRGGPSQEELDAADCGPIPVDFEATIKTWMSKNLKDPFSAQIDEIGKPAKGWWGNTGALLVSRDINFGWCVSAKINAKNSYGGYVGWRRYDFYFRNGEIKYTQFQQ